MTADLQVLTERKTLQLRHYGAAQYDPAKFAPVSDVRMRKPRGGLWTSPVDSGYGWQQWATENEFGDLSRHFDLTFTGNVLVIDAVEDLEKLVWLELTDGVDYPVFQPLASMGVDAMHLTVRGQEETRFSMPHNLYGWDCETVFVLNPASLTTWAATS